MTGQPQPLDLDAIEARHKAYTAIHINSGEFVNCSAADSANDVPVLVAEIRRLTAERDRYRDAWRNARTRARDSAADESMWRRIVTSTEQDRDRVIADNDSLRAELQQARQQNADASAYRYLADGISNTMPDQNEWDGDDAEETILLRYVQHLAQQVHQ